MRDEKDLLLETLNSHKDGYIRRLAELVAIDTRDLGHGIEGGLEEKGQEYLRGLFQEMKAGDIVSEAMSEGPIQKAMEQYQEGNPGHNYDKRYNLYARFKGTGGPSILFNGHIDTMPPGDESAWTHPPFGAETLGGRLYGLGACDMKGGLAASIMAVKLLQDAGIPLPGDVIITSVCDEEGGGNGSILAAMGGQKADAVVVCEPTEGALLLAHMGFVFFKVEVQGVSVHSGGKVNGVNAIDKAIKIIRALDELEHDWLLRYKHPLLPPPSGNVGVIEGGTAGSTVPDYCVFKTCVHYHPATMSHSQVAAEYQRAIDLCCDGDGFLKDHRPKVSVYQAGGPFEMEADHPLVGCFSAAWRDVFNAAPVIAGSPAGCDSRVWRNIAGCPTIQYGPGSLKQCHAVDEYVEIQEYLDAILIYAHLILRWGRRR
ncbi:MAG: M20 family metallopeptidase [Treponema sp.]|jgi:acetylornithine deacetylase|nr:M20 family metallopeptidase [Treponema sp.]